MYYENKIKEMFIIEIVMQNMCYKQNGLQCDQKMK